MTLTEEQILTSDGFSKQDTVNCIVSLALLSQQQHFKDIAKSDFFRWDIAVPCSASDSWCKNVSPLWLARLWLWNIGTSSGSNKGQLWYRSSVVQTQGRCQSHVWGRSICAIYVNGFRALLYKTQGAMKAADCMYLLLETVSSCHGWLVLTL